MKKITETITLRHTRDLLLPLCANIFRKPNYGKDADGLWANFKNFAAIDLAPHFKDIAISKSVFQITGKFSWVNEISRPLDLVVTLEPSGASGTLINIKLTHLGLVFERPVHRLFKHFSNPLPEMMKEVVRQIDAGIADFIRALSEEGSPNKLIGILGPYRIGDPMEDETEEDRKMLALAAMEEPGLQTIIATNPQVVYQLRLHAGMDPDPVFESEPSEAPPPSSDSQSSNVVPNPSSPANVPGEEGFASGVKLGAGRFELKTKLGQGGMGQVWLAADNHLGEDVALKLLPDDLNFDPVALDDLKRETLKARKLTHKNIIRVHDFYSGDGDAPFISMEHVEGMDMAGLSLHQNDRIFSWEGLKPVIEQLCDALGYAHDSKTIHRDIKPSNILIDQNGQIKLTDFGIAATAHDSMSRITQTMKISGTLSYMSPQQLDGRAPKRTDDIYAIGATIFDLLTSKPPFYTGDLPHQIRNLEPIPMKERLEDLEIEAAIPDAIEALVRKCLSKDPATRPQSTAEVLEQF